MPSLVQVVSAMSSVAASEQARVGGAQARAAVEHRLEVGGAAALLDAERERLADGHVGGAGRGPQVPALR